MKNKKLFLISVVACFIPFVLAALFYNNLPEQMPIHWNGAGEIDGYASKPLALFAMPIGLLLVHIFVIWMMDKDPKHRNIPKKMYTLMYFFVPVLSSFITAFSINATLEDGIDLNMVSALPILLGFALLLIGNYLPKCKQSYTVGIKTPWALDDEENWNKTHRVAGFVWMIGGILIIISCFLPTDIISNYTFIIVLALALIPYIYSYLLYKKKKGN